MGAIDEFIQAFIRDRSEYMNIEAQLGDQVRALCDNALQGNGYLWQSRVKEAESLEKKLRSRIHEYEDESQNVKDIKDLVGGRIVLAGQRHFEVAEKFIKQNFDIKDQSQHPKLGRYSNERFRGTMGSISM